MTDVLLSQTVNNGDIGLEAGVVDLSPGLETAAYLSMFGGDNWWGNLAEEIPERQYTAKTQKALETLPPSSGNLRRIEEAAKEDLGWFISAGAASSVEALASIPTVGRVRLLISIRAEGEEIEFEFIENWKASA